METEKILCEFLELIPGRNSCIINKVSGKKLIINSKFYSEPARSIYFNPRFPVIRGALTHPTKVTAYRLNKEKFGFDVYLKRLFNTINLEMDQVCLTQHQIIRLVEKRPKFIEDPNTRTLFLIKGERSFIVACARPKFHHFDDPIELTPLDIRDVIYTERTDIHVVIPQLVT